MKRILTIFVMAALAISLIQANANDSAINAARESLTIGNVTAAENQPQSPPTLVPPPPKIDATGYVLMDANTGAIIAESNMDEHMQPASLTKLMTLYLAFQALKSNQIHLDDPVLVSQKAWEMGGSKMFIKVGNHVSVADLIQGIVVASGNDACVAIAEYIAGNEDTFAALMDQTANRLGMNNTHYIDSTGLPSPEHYSTPHDMALLTRAIINDFPEYYHFFSQKWMTFNNIKQPNRNRLLWRDDSVDGLKTGHTKDAGYCLITSAHRSDMRLITVVMGTPSDSDRASDAEALLNYGFRFYKTYKLFDANTPITKPRVWLGEHKHIKCGLKNPLYVTIPIGEYKNLKASMAISQHLKAPITKDQEYGAIEITLSGKPIASAPLLALESDKKGGMWSRMTDHISLLFKGMLGSRAS